MRSWCLIIMLFLSPSGVKAQKTEALLELDSIAPTFFQRANERYSKISNDLQRKGEAYLLKMQKREKKFLLKLRGRGFENAIFQEIDSIYAGMKKTVFAGNISDQHLRTYNGVIDSLSTTLAFLRERGNGNSQLGLGEKTLEQLKGQFNKSEEIQDFLQSRHQHMKELISQYTKVPSSLKKQYSKISQTVYYYSSEMRQYRQLLDHPEKMERKALELIQKLPAFQKFMHENGELASLFSLPGGSVALTDVAGLQTRASMEELIQQRIGTMGSGVKNELQQHLSGAMQEFQKLKDNINEVTGSNEDFGLPDFKPNSQKTKTFLNRIEYGFDVQFERGTSFLPARANLGITAGYKLNDKSILGFGIAYKMGIGSIERIHISHEGLGLRSFIDWKIKKQIYVSGGYETNYLTTFKNITQLQRIDNWQSSALLGVSKRYKLNKKVQGEMKFMYDFLYRQHMPVSQPLVFRLGYKL